MSQFPFRHPAEVYRDNRVRLFNIAERDCDEALKYLSEMQELTPKERAGLNAELIFFKTYQGRDCSVNLDHGDHADFTLNMNGETFRIDVTTNISYKKRSTYEHLQSKKGYFYKIAVFDGGGFEFVDINFPLCSCGNGYLFDIIVLSSAETYMEPLKYETKCQLITLCSGCLSRRINQAFPARGLFSVLNDDRLDDDPDYDYRKSIILRDIRAVNSVYHACAVGLGQVDFEQVSRDEHVRVLRMLARRYIVLDDIPSTMPWTSS